MQRTYGWRRELPDHRDLKFKGISIEVLPPMVDLRDKMPPVYDQLNLGSCTANGIAAAYEYDHMKQGLPDFMPSRLFIYFNERAMEGTIHSDSGANIRDGVKSINKQGVCAETDWPYIIQRFTMKPPRPVYATAKKDRAMTYMSVDQDLSSMKSVLAQNFPIILGFTVYESFESEEVAKTGIVPMPGKDEKVLGGHCVLCVGYDDSKNAFIIRNSWGSGWALSGYCYMPYEYLTNPDLADDFWTIQMVQ